MDFDRLERVALNLLEDFSARAGAFLAFSGGKDSVVLRHLADRAAPGLIPSVYSVTTIDPPELMRFIHDVHPATTWRKPRRRFFRLLERNGPPTRTYRWCCRELKESFGPPPGGVLFTGVRAAESPRRARLCKQIMIHRGRNFPIVAPLFHWTDDDVWYYIDTHHVPYCTLYDQGLKRIGCVGCPMATRRRDEIHRYPYILHQWSDALYHFYHSEECRPGSNVWKAFPTFNEYWDHYWSNDPWPAIGTPEPGTPCQMMLTTQEQEDPAQ